MPISIKNIKCVIWNSVGLHRILSAYFRIDSSYGNLHFHRAPG